MMSYKKIVVLVMILVITLSIIGIVADDFEPPIEDEKIKQSSSTLLNSNLFTQKDDLSVYEQEDMDMEGFNNVLENDEIILYIHEDNLSIRLENRETGFIWSSNLTQDAEDDFNNAWLRIVNSGFSYTYYDRQNRHVSRTLLETTNREIDFDVNTDEQTVDIHVDLVNFDFKLSYTLGLENDSLTFYMNTDDIEEYGDNRMATISLFEFLGATKEDEAPGYNFIPSGNGALVRYIDNSQINSTYRADLLGRDLYRSVSENNLGFNFPVYGSVHGINQNGYFVNVISGGEFGRYNYAPPGVRTDYHRHYKSFRLRESYVQNIRGSDVNPTIIEEDVKSYEIEFNINLLSNADANYVGMAHRYKSHLIDNDLISSSDVSEAPKLHLDIFGSDYAPGLIFKNRHEMTHTDNILSINSALKHENIENIHYTLRGFNSGGYTDAAYNNYSWNNRLGDYRDLDELNTSFYYNPAIRYTLDSQAPRHALQTVSNNYGRRAQYNGDFYEYFIDISRVIREFDSAHDYMERFGGMALDGITQYFYSNEDYTRNEMYDKYDELLGEAIPMFRPNSIMLQNTSSYLNIPMQHERLRFFSDNVPFLQVVLSGEIPYYTRYLNFSANQRIELLKAVDFGAQPAFLITHEPSHQLSRTVARGYYGTHYENLEEQIISNTHFIDEALTHVKGSTIEQRIVLDSGIVKVVYANDVEIFVNYSNYDYEYENITIESLNYYVRK